MKTAKIKKSSSEVSNQERENLEADKILINQDLGSKNGKLKIESIDNDECQNSTLETNSIISLPFQNNYNFDTDSNNESQVDDNNFEEIVPLLSTFDFETHDQKIDCQNLDKVTLPESLYMLVDKKVELESQTISELPEWSFLPESELQRRAVLLFPDQRTAKRNCSRNQRVIKIPNTSIFRLSKSYLVAKGITRLILKDSLISLEN